MLFVLLGAYNAHTLLNYSSPDLIINKQNLVSFDRSHVKVHAMHSLEHIGSSLKKINYSLETVCHVHYFNVFLSSGHYQASILPALPPIITIGGGGDTSS